jgi:hypothetical protein
MTGPRRVTRDARALTAWFDDLYEIYLRRGWHPAVAAIEAELEARRHCQPVKQ